MVGSTVVPLSSREHLSVLVHGLECQAAPVAITVEAHLERPICLHLDLLQGGPK
jgi:hypothetical protein